LAAYAMKADFVRQSTGVLKTRFDTFTAVANHAQDHLLEKAKEIVDVFYSTNDRALCKELGKPYGITSCYHALGIVGNSRLDATIPVHIFAFALGDISFVIAPIEMFDTNGMYIKDNSPFGTTFVCGYANYCQGYMPSEIAGKNSGYEVVTSIFAPGNAEPLADRFVEMLKDMYEE